jgi:hypothetical protein
MILFKLLLPQKHLIQNLFKNTCLYKKNSISFFVAPGKKVFSKTSNVEYSQQIHFLSILFYCVFIDPSLYRTRNYNYVLFDI